MAVRRNEANIDVVKAAEIRIKNIFSNGLPVYMSFSGGKDSLCMAQLILSMIQRGQIDPKQLVVQFVDEEAIFPCIEKTVRDWRKKFLMVGARFDWYCIEVKHFNCFNQLTNDETFICWDSTKQDVWVRQPPSFAIRTHPLLNPRKDNYQAFLPRTCRDGIIIIGIRTAESIQRLQNIAHMTSAGNFMTGDHKMFPIYDWKDKDVWLYLLNNHVEIPEIYLYMYQTGIHKNQLRVSQFFSIDTARSLVQMNEYYPDLMERVIRREPNAYLAALYWDSEMFRRSSSKRKELENGEQEKDYKALLIDMFRNMDTVFDTPLKYNVAKKYYNFFLKAANYMDNVDCKRMHDALVAGDPKLRSYRAMYNTIYGKHIRIHKEKANAGH